MLPKCPDANPLAIVVITSGSKGHKLLFRYPCTDDKVAHGNPPPGPAATHSFAIRAVEDLEVTNPSRSSPPRFQGRSTYSDGVLATILAVQASRCGQRFDVKIDDVRFIGHPVAEKQSDRRPKLRKKLPHAKGDFTLNVVFALSETASEETCACYHELAKQIATALKHEERRCSYFTIETKQMWRIIDEAADTSEGRSTRSPSQIMLDKELPLAKTLAAIFNGLCETGIVQMSINRWSSVNFCLPLKIHNNLANKEIPVLEDDIYKCIHLIKPYHALLLLRENRKEVLGMLPVDSSPLMVRLLSNVSPFKSLTELMLDLDCDQLQVFRLAAHLVYWAMAVVIYPISDSNVYVVSSSAGAFRFDRLTEEFSLAFPGDSLAHEVAHFSLPTSLGSRVDVLSPPEMKAKLVRMVLWMLQRHLLVQMHTYVSFVPSFIRLPELRRQQTGIAVNGSCSIHADEASDSAASDSGSEHEFDARSVRSQPCHPAEEHGSRSRSRPSARKGASAAGSLAFLTSQGHEALSRLVTNDKDVDMLVRLAPYFDGSRHLEDVMYQVDVSRSELMMVLEKFSTVLCTCQSVDEATAYRG